VFGSVRFSITSCSSEVVIEGAVSTHTALAQCTSLHLQKLHFVPMTYWHLQIARSTAAAGPVSSMAVDVLSDSVYSGDGTWPG